MKNKTKRVSTRVHTRKIDRAVAHAVMKKIGIVRPNDHRGGSSFFAMHWREAEYIK